MKRETKWEHSSSAERCTRYSDFTFTEPVVSKEDNAVSTWLRHQSLVLHYAVCLLHLWQSAVINFNLTSDSDRRKKKKKNPSWKKNPGICNASMCFGRPSQIQLDCPAVSILMLCCWKRFFCLFQTLESETLFNRAGKAGRPATSMQFAVVFLKILPTKLQEIIFLAFSKYLELNSWVGKRWRWLDTINILFFGFLFNCISYQISRGHVLKNYLNVNKTLVSWALICQDSTQTVDLLVVQTL